MNDTYAYQKEFVDRAIDLLDSKGKAAVILPTGVGKSYIAADVIRHYRQLTFQLLMKLSRTLMYWTISTESWTY